MGAFEKIWPASGVVEKKENGILRVVLNKGGQFVLGGAGYGTLEVLWRGYTHTSMMLAGGLCMWMLAALARSRRPFWQRCLLSALYITAVEFAIGCVVNLWLGMEVWDYTQEAHHILGQICPRFFLLWCLLSAILLSVYKGASRILHNRKSLLHKYFPPKSPVQSSHFFPLFGTIKAVEKVWVHYIERGR